MQVQHRVRTRRLEAGTGAVMSAQEGQMVWNLQGNESLITLPCLILGLHPTPDQSLSFLEDAPRLLKPPGGPQRESVGIRKEKREYSVGGGGLGREGLRGEGRGVEVGHGVVEAEEACGRKEG